MEYNFSEVEKKWQKYWLEHETFRTEIDHVKPKFYVLDMFPYPSGAGLHVGHPLGYIASDIYARYKRLKGCNVLHPMGYDAYGLPAEQYAIQTGTHPAITTEKNILRYREQMDKIGFSYDWSREVKTCDPDYYKWTQWTFIQLFKHWYDPEKQKAEPIETLIAKVKSTGYHTVTTSKWKDFGEKEKQDFLMGFRLAYLSNAMVNWCPELGTVLANDEVVNGFTVRGAHPVERKLMKQWFLRITPYAQQLLDGLNSIDWPESIKEIQRNWIGRSEGADIFFPIKDSKCSLEIFTTRPDTIFGSTFIVLAPEHVLVEEITSPDRKAAVTKYVETTKNRSERERMAEVKKITGEFTGAYCLNPFDNTPIPIWVADYVLAGYGTGAIMAVPAHDQRDYEFAKHFHLPITEVVSGGDISESSYEGKEGILVNSGFITGLTVKDAIRAVVQRVEEMGIGKGTIKYRLHDAIFSRQRYWGEPFPIYYKEGIPYPLDEKDLPLLLPEVDKYFPTETGDPPLARAKNWKTRDGYPLETTTMPGFAGSSGYYLRYMDPGNHKEYFSKQSAEYWQNVDLYIGGSEHATGHLIYSRFWNKFLFDIGLAITEEPFQKLINQGMIQGISQQAKVYRFGSDGNIIGYIIPPDFCYLEQNVSSILLHWSNIPVEFVSQGKLTQENLEKLQKEYTQFSYLRIADVHDINEFLHYFKQPDLPEVEKRFFHVDEVELKPIVEKMSKSKFNVVNPDQIIDEYGADTLRLYEMFLGPLEQSKPWDTHGIEGVFRFIRKVWRLYHNDKNEFCVTAEPPAAEELRVLHRTIKKVQEDIERFSFNTAVSSFMICVNELSYLKCRKRAILTDFAILLSPYAPHLAEELWYQLGHTSSIANASFPEFREEYLVENTFDYPVSFNGKLRFKLTLPLGLAVADIERAVLEAPESDKWLQGKPPRKIIVVPKKIVNVVL
ncbi:MAG: class I tRNA ligase family protein [bacterium]